MLEHAAAAAAGDHDQPWELKLLRVATVITRVYVVRVQLKCGIQRRGAGLAREAIPPKDCCSAL